MCTGPKRNLRLSSSQEVKMASPRETYSKLLELAAADDLAGFIHEIEAKQADINEPSFWYCRNSDSKKMGFQLRTPSMIASYYNSTGVLKYIIDSRRVDVNEPWGTDSATPLHCAASAGSWASIELLIAASADPESTDSAGLRPRDVVGARIWPAPGPRRKAAEALLGGAREEDEIRIALERKDSPTPAELPLPDINDGVYGTDEFRMYSFKVRPCSRAYSHDWTECPFAHPGENARRRDPLRHGYTPVPCPEFKKGGCQKGDACEYAHGVFESWLHPAQYRTRLCKDETGCSRRVCFFAHRQEELRPLYASTGSGLPSPKSAGPMSPPISPLVCSSPPITRLTSPSLHLAGSRLRATVSARDLELDLKTAGLESMFSSSEALLFSHLQQGLSPSEAQALLRASYTPNSHGSHSSRKAALGYEFDSSTAMAASLMGSRSPAFAKRSQSFVDRSAAAAQLPLGPPPMLADWGSPDGRLDWGFSGDEANKLRKSASFGIRSGGQVGLPETGGMPDVSWVNSLVKDVPCVEDETRRGSARDVMPNIPHWVEQMYMDHEQMVA